ncbi:MAG TPA: organic solvent tolerance protein OstA [Lacipirellulaceae bacterium]|nr:organic solvent tolerance protein OstA [Lacipirellulaceae bacterium]
MLVASLAAWLSGAAPARADDIQAAAPTTQEPVTVAADWCSHWQEGAYDVWHLRGNCYLNQGLTYTRGAEAIVWVDAREYPQRPITVIAYFEGSAESEVVVDYGAPTGDAAAHGVLRQQRTPAWFQRMTTVVPLNWKLPSATAPTAERPPIYARGLGQFQPDRRRELLLAQYNELAPAPQGGSGLPLGMRKVSVYQRSDSPSVFETETVNGEKVGIISGGVRVLIEGLEVEGMPPQFGPLGAVDISTDRAVIWASGMTSTTGSTGLQSSEAPLEIYMEGNIEFRQGDRVVYADRMFYDARRQIGVILNAELLTPLPVIDDYQYPGLVRLKADAIRQLDATHFAATNALLTTSRLEEPAYDLSSRELSFTDTPQPVLDPATGAPVVDAEGKPVVRHSYLAEANSNVLHVRGVPVFYWPTIATDLEKPTFIIDRARIGSDSIFGTQIMVDFDAFQLFGVRNPPAGTELHLSTDYFSERGIAGGADVEYDRQELFGFIGPAQGQFEFWAIDDEGLDNLGEGRRAITPEEEFRYRFSGQHRQRLESGWEFTAEADVLSDRTFLEQYFEREWDEQEQRTGVRLKRLNNNRALAFEGNVQVNEFFSETEQLRMDHYWLGESLLGDRVTWFERTQLGYARFNVATPPTEPTLLAQFATLPWESNSEGERLITTHEFDAPLQVGAVKVVPYGLFQLGRWGEDLNGDPYERAFGQTGIRASLPMYAIYPDVRDPLFNLNGLAHKVVFDAEVSYADADENFDELPLYDPLDDISILEFRRRLFSGALPPTITDPKFDPRRYAIRFGLQDAVTSPSAEIVEDLTAVRLGVRQRWQTKRGPAGNQHIVDWLTLDLNASVFPEADRDNFGQELGLLDYDLRWHIGDRFTILSDGFADVFGDGLKTISAGVLLNRPTLGNAFVGVRSITGPVTSNVLMTSFSYRLSEKWIASAGAAYDFENTGNIGQTFSAARIGESFIATLGVNVDSSKDNLGFSFLLEPRFLPGSRLTRTTGIDVPPAGALGLE